jgi:hypothetical protein
MPLALVPNERILQADAEISTDKLQWDFEVLFRTQGVLLLTRARRAEVNDHQTLEVSP